MATFPSQAGGKNGKVAVFDAFSRHFLLRRCLVDLVCVDCGCGSL